MTAFPPNGTTISLWRRHLWIGLLIAASVVLSLSFACAVPFAALATAAAFTLPRRDALLLAGGVWFANQFVGFGFLHYPGDANTLAWGVVLGVVTVLATLASQGIAAWFSRLPKPAMAGAMFAAAFVVYEGGLFVAAFKLGGMEAFAPSIILQILELNAAGFVGLLVLDRLGGLLGLAEGVGLRFSPR